MAPSPLADGSPAHAFTNGSLVGGKYLVEQAVAEGGIGVIVVARHLALEQRVAIKYLKPKARENPSLMERFVREGRLAAQIASDHVVRVFDVGSVPDGGPYIVMEYLDGKDLGSLLRSGPISVPRVVDYIVQACDALAEAHVLRIVHRDIKPENLFLAERPSHTPILKIIDFGISKVAPRQGEDGRWAHETAADERFGTPLYMSPEQLRSSSNVDPRTDIWSLGVTMHELMTGHLPFEGDDLPQLCTSVLASEPTRLTSVLPDASPLLEAIVLKCLEKDPDLRFDNVADLAEALAPFGLPATAARAARIKDVIRRAEDSVRRPIRIPAISEVRPMAIEAAQALAARSEAPAVTAVSRRTSASSTRQRAVVLALGAFGCLAVLAVGRLDRPASDPGDRTATSFASPTATPGEATLSVPGTSPLTATRVAPASTLAPSAPFAPSSALAPSYPSQAPSSVRPMPKGLPGALATSGVAMASSTASAKAQPVKTAASPPNRRELFGGRE